MQTCCLFLSAEFHTGNDWGIHVYTKEDKPISVMTSVSELFPNPHKMSCSPFGTITIGIGKGETLNEL